MQARSAGSWVVSVVVAAAIGWFSAMEVQKGPRLADEEDAYQRFSNAFTITDSLERIEVVDRLVRRLTPETLPGAVRALRDDLIDVYNHDLMMILYYWGNLDPRAMQEAMKTWPEPRVQRVAAGEAVASVLRKEGFDAAWSFFGEIPSHQRDVALPPLVLAAIEVGSVPNLVDLVESFESRNEREVVTGIIIGQMLFLKGPEALAEWVESLPVGMGTNNDLRNLAFRGALSELMRRDQLEFLEGWIARIEDQPWAKGSRRAVAIGLATRDPLNAIAWVEKLTPEQDRDAIFDETLRLFASFDHFGALQWLRQQQPGKRFDAGHARLAYELAAREPEISVEMLGRIQDLELFSKIRKSLTAEWKQLPEVRQAKLLEMVEKLPQASVAPPAP